MTAVTAMVGAPLLQLALLELSPFTTAVGVRVGVGVFGVAGVVSETLRALDLRMVETRNGQGICFQHSWQTRTSYHIVSHRIQLFSETVGMVWYFSEVFAIRDPAIPLEPILISIQGPWLNNRNRFPFPMLRNPVGPRWPEPCQ